MASISALKQKKRGIVTFDNWSLFKLDDFVNALVSNDIYPVYNVPSASGVCGLLDLYPNLDLHRIYKAERKKIENKYPKLTKTKTGKDKAISRDYLALAMLHTMKELKKNRGRLEVYKKYSRKLGYAADIENEGDGTQCFMDHTIKNLNDDILQQHRKLHQLKINPVTSDIETVSKTRRTTGRKVTDLGKATGRYKESEVRKISKLLDLKQVNVESARSQIGGLLVLAKKAAHIAKEQISDYLHLEETGIDSKQIRQKIYETSQSYDFYGLFDRLHLKQIEHTKSNTNNDNNDIQIPSFLGKWNDKELHPAKEKRKKTKKRKRSEVENETRGRIITKHGTLSMEYFFNKDKYNDDDLEREKLSQREEQKLNVDMQSERDTKDKNKENCVKRTMGFYNTKSRAMVNQQKLDKYMVIQPPNKRRKASINSGFRMMNVRGNESRKRSDKEEMDASSDDEDDDILD